MNADDKAPDNGLAERSTEEVFNDHFALRKAGRLEDDIKRNYAKNVMIVSNFGSFFGHEGVRHSASLLHMLLPTEKYRLSSLFTHGEVAFEEWQGDAPEVSVKEGIDGFIIKNGKIVVQTIYYEPEPHDEK